MTLYIFIFKRDKTFLNFSFQRSSHCLPLLRFQMSMFTIFVQFTYSDLSIKQPGCLIDRSEYLHFWCDFIIYYFSIKVNAPQLLSQQCLEHATQKQSVQVKGELSMGTVQLDLECAVLLCKSLNFKFLTYWQSPLGTLFIPLNFITYRLSACGSTVSQNITYIQNPSYPTKYTTTGSCVFSVTPVSSGTHY